MLTQLTIQNFGLIDRLSLEFDRHLNILTGETGAGKSILIDALRIALGDRINTSQLRDPQKPCILEAVFVLASPELRALEALKDLITEEDAQCIIQRTYFSDGRQKIKINGLTVTVGQLKEIGNHLIDFHGPHDHQMLLSPDAHMGLLDQLSHLEDVARIYKEIYQHYDQATKKLEKLKSLAETRDRDMDLLSHQVKELEQVPLEEARYEELVRAQARINNAERLHECVSRLIQILEGDGSGTSESFRQAFGPMKTLNHIDEKTVSFMENLSQLQEMNERLLGDLNAYADSLSFQPDEAQEVNALRDRYDDIKRKYGPDLERARDFYVKAKEKLDLLVNMEHEDGELRGQIEVLRKKLKQAAEKITRQRQKAAAELKKTIEKELAELGIANVKFEARIEPTDFHPLGQDNVIFYISPNAGEALKPLSEIVSSGEAARVMLALKKALIQVDPIPVLIFDEIDAQIGGRLGSVTGQKLKEISRNRQVILITHLPQIASFADAHFKVTKTVKDGRAVTMVDALDKAQRVNELAQMMSGKEENPIAVRHALDMLSRANK